MEGQREGDHVAIAGFHDVFHANERSSRLASFNGRGIASGRPAIFGASGPT
jgi:hypothetical protein